MKIAVLGGGVLGVTTAYYLAMQGHDVQVIEEEADVALKASGRNGGVISPNHALSWATPAAPRMLISSLLGRQAYVQVRLRFEREFITWGLQFLRQCTSSRMERNTLAKLRLCIYSREALNDLVRTACLEYHEVKKGALYLCRTAAELDAEVRTLAFVAEHGPLKQNVLDVEAVLALEPALGPARDRFAGAVHAVDDQSGDPELFTQNLAKYCMEHLGVSFYFGTKVTRLSHDSARVLDAVTSSGTTVPADIFVVALGVGSHQLARTVGVKLPIYPVKGYSATFPVISDVHAPTTPCVDESAHVAWSRRGSTLRMTSTAEFSGYGDDCSPSDFTSILEVARNFMPDAADYTRGTYKGCLRPMTPGGPPIIGRVSRYPNLYVNSGHGHMGWAMACGSSRILSDIIGGRRPDIDPTAYQP